jgi:hypothetical protein
MVLLREIFGDGERDSMKGFCTNGMQGEKWKMLIWWWFNARVGRRLLWQWFYPSQCWGGKKVSMVVVVLCWPVLE